MENILLDRDGHLVLTDFGLSKEMKPEEVSLIKGAWLENGNSAGVCSLCVIFER